MLRTVECNVNKKDVKMVNVLVMTYVMRDMRIQTLSASISNWLNFLSSCKNNATISVLSVDAKLESEGLAAKLLLRMEWWGGWKSKENNISVYLMTYTPQSYELVCIGIWKKET